MSHTCIFDKEPMMASCKQQKFYGYFKENMEGLGLNVPSSLFYTQAEAAALLTTLLTALKTLGKTATLAELAGATTGLEKLLVLGAVRASYYIGAAIGSFAVASGRYSACGASISDVMMDVHQNGIVLPAWLNSHIAQHPEILDKKYPARAAYATQARQ
jgi:hypothetical protein